MNIDPNLWLAMEFGFKAAEKGWNLEKARSEFNKVMNPPAPMEPEDK